MASQHKFIAEVVYANPQQQIMLTVEIMAGTTVKTAIEQAGILKQFPEIDLNQNKVGIFSKIVTLETVVQAGDRIEIYHKLLIDPKTIRRQRAKQQGFN